MAFLPETAVKTVNGRQTYKFSGHIIHTFLISFVLLDENSGKPAVTAVEYGDHTNDRQAGRQALQRGSWQPGLHEGFFSLLSLQFGKEETNLKSSTVKNA